MPGISDELDALRAYVDKKVTDAEGVASEFRLWFDEIRGRLTGIEGRLDALEQTGYEDVPPAD